MNINLRMITLFKKMIEEADVCEWESEIKTVKVGLGGARSKFNIPKKWREVKFRFGCLIRLTSQSLCHTEVLAA